MLKWDKNVPHISYMKVYPLTFALLSTLLGLQSNDLRGLLLYVFIPRPLRHQNQAMRVVRAMKDVIFSPAKMQVPEMVVTVKIMPCIIYTLFEIIQ